MTSNPTHMLSVKVYTPKIATEGENAKFYYKVRNIGTTTFDGFIQIMLSWSQLNQNVYQPLNIRNLAPRSETAPINYSQAPLMSGYTWFTVVGAVATNGNPVEVFNEGGTRLFPYPVIGTQQVIQPLHAMRARSHEGKIEQNALIVAAVSLAVVAIFQIIDWALRFFYHL